MQSDITTSWKKQMYGLNLSERQKSSNNKTAWSNMDGSTALLSAVDMLMLFRYQKERVSSRNNADSHQNLPRKLHRRSASVIWCFSCSSRALFSVNMWVLCRTQVAAVLLGEREWQRDSTSFQTEFGDDNWMYRVRVSLLYYCAEEWHWHWVNRCLFHLPFSRQEGHL